jgi:hypothetical protein
MNGAKYGKGDRPRNNWGQNWYAGYTTINWSKPSNYLTNHRHGHDLASPPTATRLSLAAGRRKPATA